MNKKTVVAIACILGLVPFSGMAVDPAATAETSHQVSEKPTAEKIEHHKRQKKHHEKAAKHHADAAKAHQEKKPDEAKKHADEAEEAHQKAHQ